MIMSTKLSSDQYQAFEYKLMMFGNYKNLKKNLYSIKGNVLSI